MVSTDGTKVLKKRRKNAEIGVAGQRLKDVAGTLRRQVGPA
jgi:hypothetical protein